MPASCRRLTVVLNLGIDSRRQKARVGREKPDRVVAPVIGAGRARPDAARSTAAWIGSSSTAVTPSSTQVVDHRRRGERGESAALCSGRPRDGAS